MNNTRLARLTYTVRNSRSRRSVASVLALTGTAFMLLMPGLAAACNYCDDRFDDQTLDVPILDLPCDYCDERPGASTQASIDSDRDGLTDGNEALYAADPANPDTDFDGLRDGDEVWVYGTFPLSWDTDGDAVSDARELFETVTNPLSADSDGDGYSDSEELYRYFTNPNDYNSYPASQGKRK